jgi:hypothetical protein
MPELWQYFAGWAGLRISRLIGSDAALVESFPMTC